MYNNNNSLVYLHLAVWSMSRDIRSCVTFTCPVLRSSLNHKWSKVRKRWKNTCTWVFNVLTWKGRNAIRWLFIIGFLLLEKPLFEISTVTKKWWKVLESVLIWICSETFSRHLLLFQNISLRWRARRHCTILHRQQLPTDPVKNLSVCLLKEKMKQTNII